MLILEDLLRVALYGAGFNMATVAAAVVPGVQQT